MVNGEEETGHRAAFLLSKAEVFSQFMNESLTQAL